MALWRVPAPSPTPHYPTKTPPRETPNRVRIGGLKRSRAPGAGLGGVVVVFTFLFFLEGRAEVVRIGDDPSLHMAAAGKRNPVFLWLGAGDVLYTGRGEGQSQ